MKVLVVVSVVLAVAAAQYASPYGFGYSGVPYAAGYGLNAPFHYSTYNAAPYNFAPAAYTTYNAAPVSYAPAAYSAYAPYAYAAAAPAAVSSQYHAQNELGGYTYGYADGLSTKTESKNAYGATVGSYSYVDANNQVQTVSYTAGADGFKVQATNLPVAPVANLKAPQHTLVGPAPVHDTAEVKAAKVEHARLYAEAAAAAAAAPDARKKRSLVAPLPVSDTPEVAAAKAEHARLYAAAAAAAAAAPDYDYPLTYNGYSPAFYSGYAPATYSGYAPATYSGYAPATYSGYAPASGFSYGFSSGHLPYGGRFY